MMLLLLSQLLVTAAIEYVRYRVTKHFILKGLK
jgi:hypothetical protein